VRPVAEGLSCGPAAPADRVHAAPRADLIAVLVDESDRSSDEQGAVGGHAHDRGFVPGLHEARFRALARPPFRPAAFFWAVVPPWLLVRRRVPDPDFFPPREDAPGELAIRAARSFDIPLSFSASYCFSFFTFARFSGTSLPLSSV
jgi:hypothetical protein